MSDGDSWSEGNDDNSADGPRAPGRRRAHRREQPPADEVRRRENLFAAQIRGDERLRFAKEEKELRFDLVTATICAQCDQQKPTMFVCGHCSQVVYCGQKCADAHWKKHVQ